MASGHSVCDVALRLRRCTRGVKEAALLYLSVILLAFGVVVCAIGCLGVLLNRGTATQVGEHTEESRPPVVLSITAIIGILCVIAGAWLLHIFAR